MAARMGVRHGLNNIDFALFRLGWLPSLSGGLSANTGSTPESRQDQLVTKWEIDCIQLWWKEQQCVLMGLYVYFKYRLVCIPAHDMIASATIQRFEKWIIHDHIISHTIASHQISNFSGKEVWLGLTVTKLTALPMCSTTRKAVGLTESRNSLLKRQFWCLWQWEIISVRLENCPQGCDIHFRPVTSIVTMLPKCTGLKTKGWSWEWLLLLFHLILHSLDFVKNPQNFGLCWLRGIDSQKGTISARGHTKSSTE